jgi:hypothetical protein
MHAYSQLALKEHDDKQQYLANQHLRDIRNMYATLTDVLHKNISKVGVPLFIYVLAIIVSGTKDPCTKSKQYGRAVLASSWTLSMRLTF